eukprot:TRINITY_DN17331_c0_g1_i1.p1 TRINITY_DN17331_c0_g1~~TRINITY_DN17331_c0_g1_i1.p1  ORF type:complete len:647 (+),score=86.03 TRINITY_DN17331_c0_g1_i1:131-1942(+)
MQAAVASTLQESAVKAILTELQAESLFWRTKHWVKDELIKPQYGSPSHVQTAIAEVLRGSDLRTEIKSFVYERLLRHRRDQQQAKLLHYPGYPLPPVPVSGSAVSSVDVVEWARWRWAYLTLARLRELSREQKQPFLRPRSAQEDDEVTTHHIVDLDQLYGLLTSEMRGRSSTSGGESEFSASCSGIRGAALQSLRWSALGVQLRTESFESLRIRYVELGPEYDHLGMPPRAGTGGTTGVNHELTERKQREAQRLLGHPFPPHLQAFARFGVPPGERRDLWTKALVRDFATGGQDLDAVVQDAARCVCEWEWLTDDALRLDVAEFCANDKCYFPFDEIVEAMVLALSRDATVPESCECGLPQIPIFAGPKLSDVGLVGVGGSGGRVGSGVASGKGGASGSHGDPKASIGSVGPSFGIAANPRENFVPPCGIVPFLGFSCYASPIAFLSDRLETAYPLFRSFYCRYLCRLHTISCAPGTLLPLCSLFESLIFKQAPQVSLHLMQLGAQAEPLRIALPWIVRGFVGFLHIDQVLWLWDRVIGFDSAEPIVMLAASIFLWRARLVLGATTAAEVQVAFSDISELHTMPLLQHFLASEDPMSQRFVV